MIVDEIFQMIEIAPGSAPEFPLDLIRPHNNHKATILSSNKVPKLVQSTDYVSLPMVNMYNINLETAAKNILWGASAGAVVCNVDFLEKYAIMTKPNYIVMDSNPYTGRMRDIGHIIHSDAVPKQTTFLIYSKSCNEFVVAKRLNEVGLACLDNTCVERFVLNDWV